MAHATFRLGDLTAIIGVERLRKHLPDPQILLVHVTLVYLHRFGGHSLRGQL